MQSGLPVSRERNPFLTFRFLSASSGDVFLPCFSLGQPACLDCAVTHPQQPIYVKDASLGKCAAANRYQCEVKEKMYAEKCKENDLGFYPMVVEVFGGWGSTAVSVLRHIAKMCASRNGESEGNQVLVLCNDYLFPYNVVMQGPS